jgi:hypothetical protein
MSKSTPTLRSKNCNAVTIEYFWRLMLCNRSKITKTTTTQNNKTMKTNLIKTTILGLFAIVALNSGAFAGEKEDSAKEKNRIMTNIVIDDVKELEFFAPLQETAKVFIYNTNGVLVYETTIGNWNNIETKKLISKSNFLAEMQGNQYFLLEGE